MSNVKIVSTESDVVFFQVGVQGPAGPSAHGDLSGLDLDQHLQYHTDARGDARYTPLAHASNMENPHAVTAEQVGADATGTADAVVATHAAGAGVHSITAVTGLQTALDGKSPLAKGVTNGDMHDHSGGDGAQIAYSNLSGTPTLGTAAAYDVGVSANHIVQLDGSTKLPAVDGSQLLNLPTAGGGVTAHGALTGLSADDHAQYHNNARGDARYAPLAHASNTSNPHSVTAVQVGADATGTAAAAVAAHAGGTNVHAIAAITGLQTALDGKSSTSHDHAATYAPLAKGVTNGDTHDHNGGDGAQIAYSTLSGLPTLGTAAATNTTAYEAAGGISTHAALTTTHGISSFGATLVDDTSASVARTTLGLGGSATLSVGTTAGTVAAGDDSRIVGATAETTTTIGALINGASAKTTPVDADQIGLMDSAASNILKKLSWSDLRTILLNPVPKLVLACGVPTAIFPGNGSNSGLQWTGTRGQFTLSAAFYSGHYVSQQVGGYMYLPANFGGQTISAGMYFYKLTDDTHGEVYQDTYTTGIPPVPSSPTVFGNLSSGWLTQTTSEVTLITGISWVPGAMGPNGLFTSLVRAGGLSSAGFKTIRVKLDANTIQALLLTTVSTGAFLLSSRNQGVQNSQSNDRSYNVTSGNGVGMSTTSDNTSTSRTTIDTSASATVKVTGQLAANTDGLVVFGIHSDVTYAN